MTSSQDEAVQRSCLLDAPADSGCLRRCSGRLGLPPSDVTSMDVTFCRTAPHLFRTITMAALSDTRTPVTVVVHPPTCPHPPTHPPNHLPTRTHPSTHPPIRFYSAPIHPPTHPPTMAGSDRIFRKWQDYTAQRTWRDVGVVSGGVVWCSVPIGE